MNITIFGATGTVGRQLVTHALARGHKVTAFGRNMVSLIDQDLNSDALHTVQGYVFDEKDVRKALEGADAVFSALGGGTDAQDRTRSLGIRNITSQMKVLGMRRILAVGGMGVLPDDEGKYLLESPDYPPQYLAVGKEHAAAYEILVESGLDYTFMCPPNILQKDADDAFTVLAESNPGGWEISAGNLAMFMVMAIPDPQWIGKRVGICNT